MWFCQGQLRRLGCSPGATVRASRLCLALRHLTLPGLPWSQVSNTETAATAPTMGPTPPGPLYDLLAREKAFFGKPSGNGSTWHPGFMGHSEPPATGPPGGLVEAREQCPGMKGAPG